MDVLDDMQRCCWLEKGLTLQRARGAGSPLRRRGPAATAAAASSATHTHTAGYTIRILRVFDFIDLSTGSIPDHLFIGIEPLYCPARCGYFRRIRSSVTSHWRKEVVSLARRFRCGLWSGAQIIITSSADTLTSQFFGGFLDSNP